MCAAKLVDPRVVPVWNLQRSFRLERVRALPAAAAQPLASMHAHTLLRVLLRTLCR
jgi:hypothetical protein